MADAATVQPARQAKRSISGLVVLFVLIGALIAPFAIGFTVLAVNRDAIARNEQTAVASSTGEIERVNSGARSPSLKYYVIYEYEVDDVVYSIRGPQFNVRAKAEQEAQRGRIATVHYEAGNPGNAYLSDVRDRR